MFLTEERKREIEKQERLKILRKLQEEEQKKGTFKAPPISITSIFRIPLQTIGEVLFGISIGFMSVLLILISTIYL